VRQYFPEKKCSFILGDTNQSLEQLFNAIPKFTKDFKGLTLCFVDPYCIGDLDFNTLRQIAERLYVDFLVLIPTFTDINRNERIYTQANNHSLDKFLGITKWRDAWANPHRRQRKFGIFIAEQFCLQMQNLGYLYESFGDLELVSMESGKNLPLYHLGFFSRNQLGLRFWRETSKNTNKQLRLWPKE
jgi:three-Cys-motif partner protein